MPNKEQGKAKVGGRGSTARTSKGARTTKQAAVRKAPKRSAAAAKGSRPKKAAGPMPVESIRHKDKRVNIPTHELRDFVSDEESAPKTLLYPRDPSLDPQLVWKGKDEQDAKDLEVPVLPVYIQEKIHPQALIENLRDTAKPNDKEPELSLFDDFNGIEDFSRKVEFYQHEGHWSNRMILGESLLVMASLVEKEGLRGKVQTIYFDPPYGIKFGSNWQVSTRKRQVADGKPEDATRQPEQVRAFRDTWQLGIHSYLGYLRDRLVAARELLSDSGSVFVQIGDENLHLARAVLDEVFGSENAVSVVAVKKTGGASSELLGGVLDFVLWYAKAKGSMKYRQLYLEKEVGGPGGGQYTYIEDSGGTRRRLSIGDSTKPGRVFRYDNMTSQRPPGDFPVQVNGKSYRPQRGYWKTGESGMKKLLWARRLAVLGSTVSYVRYLDDFPVFPINNSWDDTVTSGFADKKVFVVQTSPTIAERCVLMTSDPGDLVLDPTCGSGTTAYVAEQWGRRWITIDTSRVALALARTRLMTAKYSYYLLADSKEGIQKEAELTGTAPPDSAAAGDIRKGFVYKRVPHVTLKSIANNPDISEGMSREEIDAVIARHAEQEVLYDKPYEDKKKLRVTGPFTVESLSPHRVMSADDERPRTERDGQRDSSAGQFEAVILDNLRKAGVQNRVKGERLVFDELHRYTGQWVHASGTYTDKAGKKRRVAVSIGSEHGTVGALQLREAAKEAVQGFGHDVLVVCGFAFDPDIADQAKKYGALTVLPARMNADLAMGDELLKKTGAGNLFTVFGEPDIEIRTTKDGKVQVEIRGVDVYDPTTGEIRSNSTDDIACWFIDTDYDGESFFVRHAYFTGADEPYDKLKRALRAEIDEAAWSELYSTESRSFDKPETGKIAVKVINHYGDEVLKVYGV